MIASGPDPRLRDPLSEVARKERLYLLGISMVGITIEYTGLIPQEISALGITFGKANQTALLYILAIVTAYFLLAFTINAASDFLAWLLTLRAWSRERSEKVEDREMRKHAEWIEIFDQVRTALGDDLGEYEGYKVYELGREAVEKAVEPETLGRMTIIEIQEAGWIEALRRQGREAEASRAQAAWRDLHDKWRNEESRERFMVHGGNLGYMIAFRLTGPVSILRATFEFLLPLAVGAFSIIVLVF